MLDTGYLKFIFLPMIGNLKKNSIPNINIYDKKLTLYNFIYYKKYKHYLKFNHITNTTYYT